MPDDRAVDRLGRLFWIVIGAIGLWVTIRLTPILTPFLLAAILAYVCSPAVSALARYRVPRVVGSLLIVAAIVVAVTGLVLVIVPLVQEQASRIAARVPTLVEQFNTQVSPWLRRELRIDLRLDAAGLSRFANAHREQLQAVLPKLLQLLTSNTLLVVGIFASLLLIPVMVFYLLLDWDGIVRRLDELVPPRWQERVRELAGEVDQVLGRFLRGQLLVMAVLAGYYFVGLEISGLDFALSVGLLTGLLIFIPYVGFGLGLILALLTALLQDQGWAPVIGVAVVYGIGQVVESVLLTPYLVGDKIGLHPVAVIFALLAFGHVFGFFGVLLALPASAALLVGLRHLRGAYLESPLYAGPDKR